MNRPEIDRKLGNLENYSNAPEEIRTAFAAQMASHSQSKVLLKRTYKYFLAGWQACMRDCAECSK